MGGTVVVTGASTGIGEATARMLAERDFSVLAGVRKDSDAERVGRIPGVEAVKVDVTDADSIASLRERVGESPLAGLVNNAGIAVSAPLEVIAIDELRTQFEVNVIGQIAVTQALLPALRRGKGRVVMISSIGGRLALPIAGPYAGSKFALEGLADSLRREISQHGVGVVIVEPGGIKTPIWGKSLDDAGSQRERFGPEADRLYGDLIESIEREARKIQTDTGLPPTAVAEVVYEGLTAKRPRARYLVGRDAKSRALLAKLLPDRVFDRLLARALR